MVDTDGMSRKRSIYDAFRSKVVDNIRLFPTVELCDLTQGHPFGDGIQTASTNGKGFMTKSRGLQTVDIIALRRNQQDLVTLLMNGLGKGKTIIKEIPGSICKKDDLQEGPEKPFMDRVAGIAGPLDQLSDSRLA